MLNVEDFKAKSVNEIVATARIWGQETTVILWIDLDEDEDDESYYIEKAMEFIGQNINLINQNIENVAENRERILNQLLSESPVTMVQDYLDNRINGAEDRQFQLSDATFINLPLSEEEFIEKLLICEAIFMEIDAMDEDDEPEVKVTVSFGVKDDLIGGHGWDLEFAM